MCVRVAAHWISRFPLPSVRLSTGTEPLAYVLNPSVWQSEARKEALLFPAGSVFFRNPVWIEGFILCACLWCLSRNVLCEFGLSDTSSCFLLPLLLLCNAERCQDKRINSQCFIWWINAVCSDANWKGRRVCCWCFCRYSGRWNINCWPFTSTAWLISLRAVQ